MNGGSALPEGGDPRHHLAPRPDGSGAGSHALLTLPNLITLARLCAVPGTIWLILQQRLDLAFLLFIAAGLSDALDGWLARVMNARSVIGAMLDPVADKALLVSVYVTLAAVGVLPSWLAILVVFRDVVIMGGIVFLWLLGRPPSIKPLLVSKANTVLQIGFAGAALAVAGFGLAGGTWFDALMLVTALATIASGIAYVAQTARRLSA
jgi:cardiolipin synthase